MFASFVILIIVIILAIAISSAKQNKKNLGNKINKNLDMNISNKPSNTSIYDETSRAAKIAELRQYNSHTIQTLEQKVKQQDYANKSPQMNNPSNMNKAEVHEATPTERPHDRIIRPEEMAEIRKKQEMEELQKRLTMEKIAEKRKQREINQANKQANMNKSKAPEATPTWHPHVRIIRPEEMAEIRKKQEMEELQKKHTMEKIAEKRRMREINQANNQSNTNKAEAHEAAPTDDPNTRTKQEAEIAETRKAQEMDELQMRLEKEKNEEEKQNQKISQVKKYSNRYNSLIHLFQDYQLWEDVKTEFQLSTQYDSPTAFIASGESEILARVASNKQLKASYELIKMNRASVSDYMSKTPSKITSEYNIRNSGLAEDQFLAIEQELLSELQKRLKVDISLTVIASCPYMSEKGKKTFSYSYEDLDHFYSQQNTMQNNAEEERGKMTPSLRYAVMQRDGFRCVLCGATAKDGAKLHVDHILPVSKGGKTEITNLRTLCDRCNWGKGAKYDPSGIN